MGYIPFTRICVLAMVKGVPVGVQIAWLSSNKTGCPLAFTRRAALTHGALTQGPFAAGGGGSAQPAIV